MNKNKYKFDVIHAPTLKTLIDEANENGITKEEIVNIIQDNRGYWYLIFGK